MPGVLFDMDGVVIESERYWVDQLETEIVPAAVEEEVPVSELTGRNYREAAEYLAEEYTPTADREEILELYRDAADEIYGENAELMDGFRDLLDELRIHDCPVALVSSSPPEWIETALDRFGLTDRFDAVVSVEELNGPGKPAPDAYEHAARRIDRDPVDCVAVEDSEHGVEAAAEAGVYVLGYRTDANRHLDLSRANEVVDGASELRGRLLDIVEERA